MIIRTLTGAAGALAAGFALVFGASALAQDAEGFALCESLERPNIDCACVAQRVEQYRTNAPSEAVSDLVIARYANALGKDEPDLEAAMQRVTNEGEDGMAFLRAERYFDRLDGPISDASQIEAQCVIPGVAPAPAPAPAPGTAAAALADACTESVGETQASWCGCEAAMMESIVGPERLEAYHLSFSLYPDDPTEDPAIIRAGRMGVIPARYEELQQSARATLEPELDGLRNYCTAMTWADAEDGSSAEVRAAVGTGEASEPMGYGSAEELEAAMRAAGAEADAMAAEAQRSGATSAPADIQAELEAATGTPQAMSASAIIAQGCDGSEAYCGCVAEGLDEATAGASDDARMLAAMNLVGSEIDPAIVTSVMRSVGPAAHAELGQIFPAIMPIPGRCEAAAGASAAAEAAEAARSGGDPRERYLALCEVQQGAEAADVCACSADHFSATLNDDEFDLLIRVQAADLDGQGGFESFAGDMGMSEAEAGRALASNPRLMRSMMGVQSACMTGGYP